MEKKKKKKVPFLTSSAGETTSTETDIYGIYKPSALTHSRCVYKWWRKSWSIGPHSHFSWPQLFWQDRKGDSNWDARFFFLPRRNGNE